MGYNFLTWVGHCIFCDSYILYLVNLFIIWYKFEKDLFLTKTDIEIK